jgi:demethylmenaquinone methyltransferase/2-methoxy-6-polyprenyl-1,4-benzoquinol methylase
MSSGLTEHAGGEPLTQLVSTRDQHAIADMFNAIARRYDLMNRLMSGGQDVRWRRIAADAAQLRPGQRALDVATGTGDLARELVRRVVPGGEVVGVDIATEMLARARRKLAGLPVRLELGDAMDLPYAEEFDAATVAFGLRNFSDRRRGLERMKRALRPGGWLVVLEMTPPPRGGPLWPPRDLLWPSRALYDAIFAPLLQLYIHRIIPLLGRFIAGQESAYTYLPQSVVAMLTAEQIADLFRAIGLVNVGVRRLNFGMVAICWGQKPSTEGASVERRSGS